MKVLATSREIDQELRRAMRRWQRYDWAIAWASWAPDAVSMLLQQQNRIGRVVVGMHFFQTHPEFLRAFHLHENVRFVLRTDGVFHPKLFLFSDNDQNWECIIGSANLTYGGLGQNEEVAVLISSADSGAAEARRAIDSALNGYWEQGVQLTEDEVEAYAVMWRKQGSLRRRLASRFGGAGEQDADDGGVNAVATPILLKTWDVYLQDALNDKHHTAEGRIGVLRAAREWFTTHDSFAEMPVQERKRIAGIAVEPNGSIDWLWFGSMVGAGNFKHLVIESPEGLSAALDAIPLGGPVERNHYVDFARRFQAAFAGRRGGGDGAIATATRLLALKRPDYFVCVDSKNRRELCAAFQVRVSLNLIDYWDSLCERIHEAAWWLAPEPNVDDASRDVWLGRAAFLDVLFYEPKA